MQIKDVLQKTTQFFRDKGFSSPRLDTELLLAKALRWDRMKLYLNYEYPLNEQELATARDLVRRRASGEPVAYILGFRDFYNHAFNVEPGVLIPRPETETIIHDVVEWASTNLSERADEDGLRVVDMGTGTGCIGLSILAEVPNARLLAVDISPTAVKVAAENAERLEVSERAVIEKTDAASVTKEFASEKVGGPVDVVVGNPPYIDVADTEVEVNVRKFEPHEALFSDENGLSHLRAWAKAAADLVRPGGMVMFEMGYQQGPQVRAIFEAVGRYSIIEIVPDLAGLDRFVRAIRAEEV